MSTSRTRHQPLDSSKDPRWIVVRDMQNRVIPQQLLPPLTDLHNAFIRALAAQVESDWAIENFSSDLSFAFCHRGKERRIVAVEAADPTQPTPARPFPGS